MMPVRPGWPIHSPRRATCPENLGDFRMIILNRQLSVDGKQDPHLRSVTLIEAGRVKDVYRVGRK